MICFLFLLFGNANVSHSNESAGVAEEPLEKYNISVSHVVHITEGLAERVGADVLSYPAGRSSIFQLLPEGVYFNVTTLTRVKNVFMFICLREISMIVPS